MLFDTDNLVGIDAEWRPGYDYVLLCLYGKVNGKSTQKTIDMQKTPESLDKFKNTDAVYFVSPMDIVAARRVAPCRSYSDIAILCSASHNQSRFKGAKNGTSLHDRVYRHLGYSMQHTLKSADYSRISENSYDKKFWDKLKTHCMEDAASAYNLAAFLNRTTEIDKQRFDEWNSLSQRWIPILQQGTPMNPRLMDYMKNRPEEFSMKIVTAWKSIGCDALYYADGLHLDLKKMQDYYVSTKDLFNWIETPSAAAWADGRIFKTDRDVWYDFSRNGTPEQKRVAGIIYSGLLLWYFQQNRFDWSHVVDHLEVTFGQQSGRASPVHHPLNSGGFFRAAVRPLPGECIVSLDISSQEPRISAWLSQDPELLKATSGDVYSEFARTLNPELPERLKKTDPERARVKPIVLSFCYGGGYRTFAGKLHCTVPYAKYIEKRLNERFFVFKSYCRDVQRWGHLMGFVETKLHKFPLQVDEYSNPRQIVNHLVQGTAADLLRLIVRDLQDAGFNIFATLFDGVYLRMPIPDAESGKIDEACKVMERCLETNYPVHVPWKVEAQEDHWYLQKIAPKLREQDIAAGKPPGNYHRRYFVEGVFEKPEYIELVQALGLEALI